MSSRLHRAHRARMTECVDAIATAISVASDASAWGRVVSGAVDEHSGHVYTSRFRSGPVVSCREQRAAEPGVSDDRQFGGTVIRMVIEHCRDHVAGVSVDRLLSLANERRSLSVLVDDASWSSYGQVCAVLEAAAQLLSGAEKLAAIGERAAIARSRRCPTARRNEHCDSGQGHLPARPLTAPDVEALLTRHAAAISSVRSTCHTDRQRHRRLDGSRSAGGWPVSRRCDRRSR
jgi:hypothetical protein